MSTQIREARLLAGLSHRQAAKAAGVDKDTIVKYERPDRERFSTDILAKLAAAYGVSMAQLLGEAPLPDAEPTAGGAA